MKESKTIRIHPSTAQFVVNDFLIIILAVVILLLVGWDGLLPRSVTDVLMAADALVVIFLFCRYFYLTRMVYIIGGDQFIHQHGILSTTKDFIELYRIVDYSEHCNFLQMMLGIKTVSIYSGDKTHPRTDLVGIKSNFDVIGELRIRVEESKRQHNIHEFTNM